MLLASRNRFPFLKWRRREFEIQNMAPCYLSAVGPYSFPTDVKSQLSSVLLKTNIYITYYSSTLFSFSDDDNIYYIWIWIFHINSPLGNSSTVLYSCQRASLHKLLVLPFFTSLYSHNLPKKWALLLTIIINSKSFNYLEPSLVLVSTFLPLLQLLSTVQTLRYRYEETRSSHQQTASACRPQ